MKKIQNYKTFVADKSDLRGWKEVPPPHFADEITVDGEVHEEKWLLHEDIFACLKINKNIYKPAWFLGFYDPSGETKTSLPLKIYNMNSDVNKKYIKYK